MLFRFITGYWLLILLKINVFLPVIPVLHKSLFCCKLAMRHAGGIELCFIAIIISRPKILLLDISLPDKRKK